jgi:hypothetical protein
MSAAFLPRPFPPPALADVPVEYIVDQLRNLAPHYWNRPDTADCTIVVPIPGQSMRETPESRSTSIDPSGLGRRVTEPALRPTPRISLKLHMDYLSAQSTFLRGLFSGASPLDLINTNPNAPPAFNTSPRTPSGQFTVPSNRLPRLLSSTPHHPVVFLPVPDPSSFHLLVHWIYFGRTNYIEECLAQGVIQWEGVARNVEYLGLPTDIKVFLGRWYGNWLHPGRSRADSYDDSPFSDDEDTDVEDDDDTLEAEETDECKDVDSEEWHRGRSRTTEKYIRQPSAIHSTRPRSA